MSALHRLLFRLGALFRRQRTEDDLTAEIRAHLEMAVEQKIAEGLPPAEARRAALREFGSVEPMKERWRAERRFVALEQFGRDLRLGLRALRRQPGFSAVAILTLAVALGVNTSIFALVNAVLLREPVAHEPERVACLFTGSRDAAREFRPFSHAEFKVLRGNREVFTDTAAVAFSYLALGRDEALRRSFAFLASENFFALLGARPVAGRFFTADECRPGAGQRVLVASHELWQREGGGADFLGRTLLVNGREYTVVGIAPPGFGGITALIVPDCWLPLGVYAETTAAFAEATPALDLQHPTSYALNLVGRLRDGLTLERARPLLPVLAARLEALPGRAAAPPRELLLTKPFGISPQPPEHRPLQLLAALLLAMAGIVLLIACLNLANMLLARSATRAPEIALRLALGASRGQIVRQLLTEGLVLALVGGVLGLLFSAAANAFLQRIGTALLSSMSFNLSLPLQPNAAVLGATFAFCLLATLLFSLLPAWRAARADLVHDLKSTASEAGATGAGWDGFFAGRHLLVMAQLALSVVLVFSAGLFLRGALRAGGAEVGFRPEGVALAEFDFTLANTPPAEARRRQLRVLETVARLPGVEAAGLASCVPYKNEIAPIRVVRADVLPAAPGATRGIGVLPAAISPGYLPALGVRLLRGRNFSESELAESGGRRVCLLDENLAARLFPGEEPLGQRVREARPGAPELEVVGLVARHNQDVLDKERPLPRLFVPLGQWEDPRLMFLAVRLRQSSPVAVVAALAPLRQALRELDPDLPMLQLLPFEQYLGKSYNLWMGRIGAALFGFFGGIALLLAALGVYGVRAYSVQRRTRELGIRLALGATKADILWLVLRQGALQTAVAVGVGLVLALPVGRAAAFYLHEIRGHDPVLLLAAAGVLSAAALLASFLPARRAARISPLRALRTE
ncbi:MAG: ABC transporter permease [Verrucomicrobia bacterium]|nr:ABC transporter permease [Verrucomicrobiota bacterium]